MSLDLASLAGRATCSVPEAGQLLGIGRDAAYAAAERGELPCLRLGRRLVVPVPRLLDLLGAVQKVETEALDPVELRDLVAEAIESEVDVETLSQISDEQIAERDDPETTPWCDCQRHRGW